jgi:hypothetical protein
VTVDRTGPDCGRICARLVPCLGPVQRWAGSPFTQKWIVAARPVRTHEPDRAGPWTGPDPKPILDRTPNPDRLVIRGCGQPLYKRFHHRKIVAEIKRQYNERKNDLLATF